MSLTAIVRDWAAFAREVARAWWTGADPPPVVNVKEPTRKLTIREAEYNQRVEAMSKVGRVTAQPVMQGREGRMVRFVRTHTATMGYPNYDVISQRGGFLLGRLEFRNQWREYAYYGPRATDPDGYSVPLNMEILAEIYAMLRELRGSV